MSEQLSADHRVTRAEIREIRITHTLASAVGPRGSKYLELRFDISVLAPMFVVKARQRIDEPYHESSYVFLGDAIDAYNNEVGP